MLVVQLTLECEEYILITLRNAFLNFKTDALKCFRISDTGGHDIDLIVRKQSALHFFCHKIVVFKACVPTPGTFCQGVLLE